jgi:hypothetical protein
MRFWLTRRRTTVCYLFAAAALDAGELADMGSDVTVMMQTRQALNVRAHGNFSSVTTSSDHFVAAGPPEDAFSWSKPMKSPALQGALLVSAWKIRFQNGNATAEASTPLLGVPALELAAFLRGLAAGASPREVWDHPTRGLEVPTIAPPDRQTDDPLEVNTIPSGLLVGLLILAVFVFWHEVTIDYFQLPPCCAPPALPERGRGRLQILLLGLCVLGPIEAMSFMPLSMDLSYALGRGASASGALVGVTFAGGCVGTALASFLLGQAERDWDQRGARKLTIMALALEFKIGFIFAVTLKSGMVDHHAVLFYVLLGVRLLLGLFLGLSAYTTGIMIVQLTPPSERVRMALACQVTRNTGLFLGPTVTSVVLLSVRGSGSLTAFTLTAWPALVVASFALVLCGLFTVSMPTELPPVMEDIGEGVCDVRRSETPMMQQLNDEASQRMVQLATLYAFERAFTVAAVEVVTAMVLEVQYGWGAVAIGFLFGVMAVPTVALSLTGIWLLSCRAVPETVLFMALALVSLGSCAFMLDLPGFGPWGLVAADMILYSASSVAFSISEGLAMRVAKPGTPSSVKSFRCKSLVAAGLARLVAPPVARGLVDLGGRNLYGAVQFAVTICGFVTVVAACNLLGPFRLAPPAG